MNVRRSSCAVAVSALVALAAPLAASAAPPLTIKEQGSFFVGGEIEDGLFARRRADSGAVG